MNEDRGYGALSTPGLELRTPMTRVQTEVVEVTRQRPASGSLG
jgi:hypothetical protein